MLTDGESYGWALFGELRDRGMNVEQSLAYRDLRELERDGLVTSRWTKSEAGPQRRSYRLTCKGRRALADMAETVSSVWELHEAFVRAHQNAHGDAGADGRPAPADPAEPAGVPDGEQREQGAEGEGSEGAPRPAHDPAAVRPGRELLAAWLLLLLENSVSYGYELRHELDARRIKIDPATLYRLLRKLESSGWLESRWMESSAGPRRRFYRVTAKGRRSLDELAGLIRRVRDSHGGFLRSYEAACR